MGKQNWSVSSHVKRAVKKISFLFGFSIRRWWRVSSVLRCATSNTRVLSFNDRPGLRVCTEEDARHNENGSVQRLRRMRSYGSDEDIDRRAEMFIANFYRQLRMERQISLEPRYCGANIFESDDSSSLS